MLTTMSHQFKTINSILFLFCLPADIQAQHIIKWKGGRDTILQNESQDLAPKILPKSGSQIEMNGDTGPFGRLSPEYGPVISETHLCPFPSTMSLQEILRGQALTTNCWCQGCSAKPQCRPRWNSCVCCSISIKGRRRCGLGAQGRERASGSITHERCDPPFHNADAVSVYCALLCYES